MSTSMPRRLSHLKKLTKIYADLEQGSLINKHFELLRVCTIQNSIHSNHPHDMVRVYISRKALKHFVESRIRELKKRHTTKQIIEHLYFAIDSIKETVTNFDLYEQDSPKYTYIKDYSNFQKPQLCVVLEYQENCLEIVSIHFREKRKAK